MIRRHSWSASLQNKMSDVKSVIEVLHKKAGFETVNHEHKPNQLRLMGRVHTNMMGHWKLVMHTLLSSQDSGWKVDLSKNYFLRGTKVFYAWRIIVQGEDYDGLVKVINGAPAPNRAEIMEVPLVGVSASRNSNRVFAGGTVPLHKLRNV